MLTTTLSALRASVRKRADVESATVFIPDADVNEYVNRAIARVHGELARSGEPYYRTSFQFNAVSGQQTYYTTSASGVPAGTNVLPTDIFLVQGLDFQQQNGRWINCESMNWERRNDFQVSDWYWPYIAKIYAFQGSGANQGLFIAPPPGAATETLRLWYYPIAPQLVSDSDTWDTANRWDSYVIDWAARLCAEKDENYQLCQRLDQQLAELDGQIKAEAARRNQNEAPKIRRSRYLRRGFPWGVPGGIP